MHILENYSCFQLFFFKFSIFYQKKKTISPKNIFEDFFTVSQDIFLILKKKITFL